MVLRQALAASPDDPEVLMHLGRALIALNRVEEAQPFLAKFQQVRKVRPRDPRREAGMIELATLPAAERTQRQIERLRRDARAHPGDAELQLHLASLLLADGRLEEASAEFRELLTRNADSRFWEQAGAALVRAERSCKGRRWGPRRAWTWPLRCSSRKGRNRHWRPSKKRRKGIRTFFS